MTRTTVLTRPAPAPDEPAARPAAVLPWRRAALIAGPVVVLVVGVLATLVALEIGGAAAPLAIDDTGPVVRFGLPLIQTVLDVAAAGAVGTLVLTCFGIRSGTPRWERALDVTAASAGLWAVCAALLSVLALLDAAPALKLTSSGFGSEYLQFLTANPLGQSWLATMLAAAVLTVLAIAVRSPVGVAVLVVGAVAALVPMAEQGHAASANSDHDSAITAFGLHIVFAAVWLGGLMALTLLGRGLSGHRLAELVSRYSTIALIAYVVVAISGVISAVIRIGSWPGLLTAYGVLVVVKSLALIAMGGLGVLYRRVVIRRIAGGSGRRPFWLLAGAELALMGVASGFAAALSRTAPPVNTDALSTFATPAQILTDGQSLPPAPSLVAYLTQWRPDLIWILGCAALLLFYWAGVVRLLRRGDRWPLHRPIMWTLGVVVLLVLTNGGLNEYEKFLFSAHMLLHMLLTMVVPLLLVPAAPVTLAMRAIERRTDGTMGGREWLLLVVHSRVAGVLANPVVAGALFAGSLVVFYYSPVFSWATTDHVGHEWMTAHFLVTGYLFVQSLIGVDPLPHRWPYPLRLLVLLATMAFHAFFGLSLLNGKALLLADWYGAMGWGTSALSDQQLGGAIAWSVGEIPTLLLAIAVAVAWSRSDERESRRSDRAADRDGDADLTAYNDMLASRSGTRA